MIENRYTIKFGADFRVFEFDSEGPKGRIRKIVQYTEINVKDFYNLGFGDKNSLTNQIDDLIVTNNNDSQKVLATVAATLLEFTNHHPDSFVMAIGSALARTRLYRIGISNNLKEIEKSFLIYGLKDKSWHRFERDINYEAFLVQRKKINFVKL
ncbi:MAG TPA: hypothetical protein VIJ95_04130 [Hanamia sp.]